MEATCQRTQTLTIKTLFLLTLLYNSLQVRLHTSESPLSTELRSRAQVSSQAFAESQACFTYLDQLIDQGELAKNPAGLILDFVNLFCYDFAQLQIQESVLPYYCFYTGMSLLAEIQQAPTTNKEQANGLSPKQQIISDFCKISLEGHQQRKKLLSKVYLIRDLDEFVSQCKSYYDNRYNFEQARFDLVDFSRGKGSGNLGMMESSQLCETIFGLVDVLRKMNKDSLMEVTKYSYTMTLQNFIENAESEDFGSCEEDQASDLSFCMNYFPWESGRFVLWDSKQVSQVCGKIVTSLEKSVTKDRCAFAISRVYESYNHFIDKLIDEILLEDKFEDYYELKMRENNNLIKDFEGVMTWLEELDVEEEQKREEYVKQKLQMDLLRNEREIQATESRISELKSLLLHIQTQNEYRELNETIVQLRHDTELLRERKRKLLEEVDPVEQKSKELIIQDLLKAMFDGDIWRSRKDFCLYFQRQYDKKKISDFFGGLLQDQCISKTPDGYPQYNVDDYNEMMMFVDELIGEQNRTEVLEFVTFLVLWDVQEQKREKVVEFLGKVLEEQQYVEYTTLVNKIIAGQFVNDLIAIQNTEALVDKLIVEDHIDKIQTIDNETVLIDKTIVKEFVEDQFQIEQTEIYFNETLVKDFIAEQVEIEKADDFVTIIETNEIANEIIMNDYIEYLTANDNATSYVESLLMKNFIDVIIPKDQVSAFLEKLKVEDFLDMIARKADVTTFLDKLVVSMFILDLNKIDNATIYVNKTLVMQALEDIVQVQESTIFMEKILLIEFLDYLHRKESVISYIDSKIIFEFITEVQMNETLGFLNDLLIADYVEHIYKIDEANDYVNDIALTEYVDYLTRRDQVNTFLNKTQVKVFIDKLIGEQNASYFTQKLHVMELINDLLAIDRVDIFINETIVDKDFIQNIRKNDIAQDYVDYYIASEEIDKLKAIDDVNDLADHLKVDDYVQRLQDGDNEVNVDEYVGKLLDRDRTREFVDKLRIIDWIDDKMEEEMIKLHDFVAFLYFQDTQDVGIKNVFEYVEGLVDSDQKTIEEMHLAVANFVQKLIVEDNLSTNMVLLSSYIELLLEKDDVSTPQPEIENLDLLFADDEDDLEVVDDKNFENFFEDEEEDLNEEDKTPLPDFFEETEEEEEEVLTAEGAAEDALENEEIKIEVADGEQPKFQFEDDSEEEEAPAQQEPPAQVAAQVLAYDGAPKIQVQSLAIIKNITESGGTELSRNSSESDEIKEKELQEDNQKQKQVVLEEKEVNKNKDQELEVEKQEVEQIQEQVEDELKKKGVQEFLEETKQTNYIKFEEVEKTVISETKEQTLGLLEEINEVGEEFQDIDDEDDDLFYEMETDDLLLEAEEMAQILQQVEVEDLIQDLSKYFEDSDNYSQDDSDDDSDDEMIEVDIEDDDDDNQFDEYYYEEEVTSDDDSDDDEDFVEYIVEDGDDLKKEENEEDSEVEEDLFIEIEEQETEKAVKEFVEQQISEEQQETLKTQELKKDKISKQISKDQNSLNEQEIIKEEKLKNEKKLEYRKQNADLLHEILRIEIKDSDSDEKKDIVKGFGEYSKKEGFKNEKIQVVEKEEAEQEQEIPVKKEEPELKIDNNKDENKSSGKSLFEAIYSFLVSDTKEQEEQEKVETTNKKTEEKSRKRYTSLEDQIQPQKKKEEVPKKQAETATNENNYAFDDLLAVVEGSSQEKQKENFFKELFSDEQETRKELREKTKESQKKNQKLQQQQSEQQQQQPQTKAQTKSFGDRVKSLFRGREEVKSYDSLLLEFDSIKDK